MGKNLLPAVVAVLSLVSLAGVVRADQDVENKRTGLAVELPDDWKLAGDGKAGDVVQATTPDGGLTLVMVALDPADAAAAVAGIKDALKAAVTEMKMEEPKPTKTHGVSGLLVKGTGKAEGKPVHFRSAVMDAGDDCLVVFVFGDEAALKKHEDAIGDVFASVHKHDEHEHKH